MRGDQLPERDRVVRYLSATMIDDDGSADGAGFCLRATRPEETGLSVNWLEVLASGGADALSEVRRLSRLQLRRSGRFAELGVGDVLCAVSEELDTLRIVHVSARGDGGVHSRSAALADHRPATGRHR